MKTVLASAHCRLLQSDEDGLPIGMLGPEAPDPTKAGDDCRSRPRGADPARARILLVDDDPVIRLALERQLRRAGFDCCVEPSAEAAAPRLEEAFDILITDFHMPGCDGAWLVAKCRAIAPETTRILISGDPAAGQVADADVFIPKPVAHITGILEALVRRRTTDSDVIDR